MHASTSARVAHLLFAAILLAPASAFAWGASGHAHAFDALRTKDSDADPSCIGCHTVGFGEESGYQRSMQGRQLVHVGCESCHGPAADHVKQRTAAAAPGDPRPPAARSPG